MAAYTSGSAEAPDDVRDDREDSDDEIPATIKHTDGADEGAATLFDPPGPAGFLDDDAASAAGGTVAEDDLEDLQARGLSATAAQRPPRNDPPSAPTLEDGRVAEMAQGSITHLDDIEADATLPPSAERPVARDFPAATKTSAQRRPKPVTLSSDMMPTVAHQPIYRPEPRDPSQVEPEQPERPVLNPEQTDNVRARRGPRDAASNLPQDVERATLNRNLAWLIAGVMGLVVLIIVLAVLIPGPRTADKVADGEQTQRETGEIDPEEGSQAGMGEVRIETEPGATIAIDGKVLGKSDAEGVAGPFSLAAGPHELTVSDATRGFERTRQLQVRAGSIHEAEARARSGWVEIRVAPWAKVRIGDKDFGITPVGNILLPEGTHMIALENPDIKKRHQRLVRVEADKVVPVRVDLNVVGDEM